MERKIIYLDDAIDALRYAQHRFTVADEAGGMGTVKWSEDVIYFATAERVLAELPSAQPEQRWIPVSERLPEPRVDVWVNSDIGQIQGYYEEHVGVWYASFGQGRDYLELIVNAWMPLPEPYKEEQE